MCIIRAVFGLKYFEQLLYNCELYSDVAYIIVPGDPKFHQSRSHLVHCPLIADYFLHF